MIRINCTNCKAQLSVDEAFAGGACRCQYCGTIQTVPKHLKNAGDAGSSGAVVGAKAQAVAGGQQGAKSLYAKKGRADTGLSSGLDALADAVASSGLSGSGLTSGRHYRKPSQKPAQPAAAPSAPASTVVKTKAPPPGSRNRLLLILVGSGVVIVLLLGVVIGLLLKGNGNGGGGPEQSTGGNGTSTVNGATSSSGTPANPIASSTPTPPAPIVTPPAPSAVAAGPQFLGVPLPDPTVVFVLDHGSASAATLDYSKTACLAAIDHFRPEQKFQVVFWKTNRDVAVATGPANLVAPSKASVTQLERFFDDVSAVGSSELRPALDKAFASHPAAMVLVTPKQIDDLDKVVLEARGTNGTKVYCFAIDEAADLPAMQEIARKTGGVAKVVTMGQLQSVGR